MAELLTAVGLILAVLLAYMQIQKTHAANIRAQEAHLRDQLRVRIYEEASTTFHNASRLVGRCNTDTRSIISCFEWS